MSENDNPDHRIEKDDQLVFVGKCSTLIYLERILRVERVTR